MLTIVFAGAAAVGVYLLLPDSVTGRTTGTSRGVIGRATALLQRYLASAGLTAVSPRHFVLVSVGVGSLAACIAGLSMGPGLPMVAIGLVVACTPAALWRRRGIRRREAVAEAWPRLIEEIRVRVGALGQSIPQALLECGPTVPEALRGSFDAARREWALTTDFRRTVSTLKESLADPTADAVCETLLVVHEVGGDLDERLDSLASDRRTAQRDRREAAARQAGARVARWFVIVVPAGMALAGMSLGEGADAYRSTGGQVASVAAIGLIALCWWWAGRIMEVPVEQRVFER